MQSMAKTKTLSRDDVAHIAALAQLPLSEDELELFKGQLASTLEYIDMLQRISTENISFPPQITGLSNVLRDDVVEPSFTQEQALSGAKNTHNGYFVVPAIFEE